MIVMCEILSVCIYVLCHVKFQFKVDLNECSQCFEVFFALPILCDIYSTQVEQC